MVTKLVPHVAVNLVTKKQEELKQFLVFDGHEGSMDLVGLVGKGPKDKLILFVQLDPDREARVREHVQTEMSRQTETVIKSELTEDQIYPPQDTFDEFDESDLT